MLRMFKNHDHQWISRAKVSLYADLQFYTSIYPLTQIGLLLRFLKNYDLVQNLVYVRILSLYLYSVSLISDWVIFDPGALRRHSKGPIIKIVK